MGIKAMHSLIYAPNFTCSEPQQLSEAHFLTWICNEKIDRNSNKNSYYKKALNIIYEIQVCRKYTLKGMDLHH